MDWHPGNLEITHTMRKYYLEVSQIEDYILKNRILRQVKAVILIPSPPLPFPKIGKCDGDLKDRPAR
jgi:hypothetical protein